MAQANQPPQFAISPALINNGVLNYAVTDDRKLFKQATYPLSEELYDLGPDGLTAFLADVDNRVVIFGMDAIISIPEDATVQPAANQVMHILTTEYGRISLEQVRAHVDTYMALDNRDVQNSFMLYNCLWNSLSASAKRKINLLRKKFTVNGNGVRSLLLKVIIQTAYVDTQSTTMQLRSNLASLDTYMSEVKSNIDIFNDHVRATMDGLAARGETSQDLISNLFRGYKAASDQDFREFVKRKKDAYNEDNVEITPEDLMVKASFKYNALKNSGLWNKASQDQERIIALETQIAKLKKHPKTPKGGKTPGKDDEKKASPDKPKWINTAPTNGQETRRFNNKTYYWCKNHGRWSTNPKHTTATCRGVGVKKDPKEQPKSDGNGKETGQQPAIKLAKALQSVADQQQE